VGIQFANVTDVLDPANLGASEGTQIQGMDLIQFIAFDTRRRPGLFDRRRHVGKDQEFVGPNHPDFQLYFHSNFSQQGTYLGHWQQTELVQFVDGSINAQLKGRAGEFFVGATLPGVDILMPTTPAQATMAGESAITSPWVTALRSTHSSSCRSRSLCSNLTAQSLDHGTIGIWAANGDGSAVDSIPNDPATSSTPGVSARTPRSSGTQAWTTTSTVSPLRSSELPEAAPRAPSPSARSSQGAG